MGVAVRGPGHAVASTGGLLWATSFTLSLPPPAAPREPVSGRPLCPQILPQAGPGPQRPGAAWRGEGSLMAGTKQHRGARGAALGRKDGRA